VFIDNKKVYLRERESGREWVRERVRGVKERQQDREVRGCQREREVKGERVVKQERGR
jgi:hypothetical protein